MKGTCRWSDLGQKLIAHAPKAGQHLASACRELRTHSIFREMPPAWVRLFWALRRRGDVIVIELCGLSLTCETCSVTFAPWQKRASPLRAHRAGPRFLAAPHLRC